MKDFDALVKRAGIAKHGLGYTCWEGQLERFYDLVIAAHEAKQAVAPTLTEEMIAAGSAAWMTSDGVDPAKVWWAMVGAQPKAEKVEPDDSDINQVHEGNAEITYPPLIEPKAEKAQDFELPVFLNNQLAACGYYTADQMREAITQATEAANRRANASWKLLCEKMAREYAGAAPAAQPELTTCNCRWDGETQVQQCTLHEAHVDAIHEWAERAKTAEKALAQQGEQQRIQELEQELAAEIELRGKLEQECVNWRVKYTNLEMAQQGEQQPVAWLEQEWSGSGLKHLHFERREPTVRDEVVCPVWTPLYAGAAPAPQAQQEPVAWGIIASNTGRICQVTLDAEEACDYNSKHIVPLYAGAAPAAQSVQGVAHPACKPDASKVIEQLLDALNKARSFEEGGTALARVALAAGQKLLKELK